MTERAGHRLTTLPSGVRVVTEAVPGVRSVAFGVLVGTGSAAEAPPVAGWAHLLEHLLFRGTEHFSSQEIDERFDAFGGEIDAGTGRESTGLSARVLDEHLDEAFAIMADMVWRPRIEAADVASEQKIVLEEIAMYEDDPQDQVFDLLGGAIFGEHPLGRPVIGARDSVAAAGEASLRDFHAERYAPGDIVVAAAGSVDHEALLELVEGAQARDIPGRTGPRAQDPPTGFPARRRFQTKPTEQYHVTLGGPGLARNDERRWALRVLDAILGGTPSSRLFQEVRERRALAYHVSSFYTAHARTGQFGVYLGTQPANLAEALEVTGRELERLRAGGVEPAELERCREHAKGRMVLGLESPYARMTRLGGTVLAGRDILQMEEMLERVDAVTAEDVDALAHELLDPARLSAAAIGPDEASFDRAIANALGDVTEVAA